MLADEIGPRPSGFIERSPLPRIDPQSPHLVLLAAGRGSRFGDEPKCVQPVRGAPLARLAIAAFACASRNPAACVVGYRADEVMRALGEGNRYVLSSNPTGGTAWAALEAASQPELLEADPVLCIAMGDRIVPPEIFARILARHVESGNDLTFLSVRLASGKREGKGRVVFDSAGRVAAIREQRDIDQAADETERAALLALEVVNCPLYVLRARLAWDELRKLTRANAQGQYYVTDIVASVASAGGRVATETVEERDPSFALLSCDLTRPSDLPAIERAVSGCGFSDAVEADRAIRHDRPEGQLRAIARQISDLCSVGLDAGREVGVGISGGRLRIAFMHPDMVRFYGPAWQVPIGSADALSRHQIVSLLQPRSDGSVSLSVLNPFYRGDSTTLPADAPWSYPGPEISDWYEYEAFGTRMSREILLRLGYQDDREAGRRSGGASPESAAHAISANLRRPFPLVMNALGSLRTLAAAEDHTGVRAALFPPGFGGLSVVLDGDIPRGGFSSSSAVTVAIMNALNALFGLGLSDERVVRLACQSEFGTGVRAGSLDQATEQMGSATQGAIVSSNPRDGYGVLGRFAMPSDRIRILFPYSVDRDREAWRWSGRAFAADGGSGVLTTGEMRKLTGKSAEIAAMLLGYPLEQDFFEIVQPDLLASGTLSTKADAEVRRLLRGIPGLVSRKDLSDMLAAREGWLADQLARAGTPAGEAAGHARRRIASLLEGWRDPLIAGRPGVPLRAVVAYLFAEVAKCFHLVHHPEDWIAGVTRSQAGDRWFIIDADALPSAAAMSRPLPWERNFEGPALLEEWLSRFGAEPHDLNLDIDDASLGTAEAAPPRLWRGPNFFRGLALLDLVEAMLKRAFGADAVALRVNAAGQGDYYQVHVDIRLADPEEVKSFIRSAVYRRFDLHPEQEFVEVYPGGRAAGVRLGAFSRLPMLASLLRP
jgi:CTP:molybdopterin cytidylyltransferase MocA